MGRVYEGISQLASKLMGDSLRLQKQKVHVVVLHTALR